MDLQNIMKYRCETNLPSCYVYITEVDYMEEFSLNAVVEPVVSVYRVLAS